MASDVGLVIDNRYEVLRELGRGGMGVVYKATDTKMDRVVAIKVMIGNVAGREEYRERFLREAKSVAKLQHPNIVVVHDYGEHSGAPYMAMEYVEGTPLDKLIAAGVELSLVIKLDYVIQVCHALGYAHQFGIVHRDVKPANIMVLEGGQRVKLVDFGIARAGGASNLSKSGLLMGTIFYMSPQQMRGQRELDGRADIFSVGVVLYELFAGAVPWTGDSDYDVMQKIISAPFPPLSRYLRHYPPALDGILERALAKEVTERYQRAEDMAVELAELQTPLKEQLLQEARASLEDGDVLRAHDLVSQILRVDTRHGEALEFRNQLQQFGQLQQRSEQLRNLRASAEQALGQKRYQDALAAIDQALALHSTNAELLRYRDLIRQELRRREDVRKKLELAQRAEEINDLSSAQELVEKALELDPTDTQARMLKAVLAQRVEAEQKQRKVKELADEAQRALAARRVAELQAIIGEIEGLDPNFAGLAALKRSAVEAQEHERRRRELEQLVREVQRVLNRAQVAEALQATQQALAKFPGEPTLVRLRTQAEALRNAQEEASRKAATEARQPDVDATLRSALAAEPDPEAQLRLAEEVLRVNPGHTGVEQILAEVRDRQQRVAALVRSAETLEKAQQYAEAIREWESVGALCPQYPGVQERITRLRVLPAQTLSAPPAKPQDFSASAAPPSIAAPSVDLTATMVLSAGTAAKTARKPAPPQDVPAPVRQPQPRKVEVAGPRSRARGKVLYLGIGVVVVGAVAIALYFTAGRATGVRFAVEPTGARVSVANTSCVAPCELQLKPGDYAVEVTRDGYARTQKQISVGSAPQTVSLRLEAAVAGTGKLVLESNVEAVKVRVDGVLRDITTDKTLTLELPAGSHEVAVEKTGYEAAAQQVEVAPNQEVRLQFTMSPAVGTPAVPVETDVMIRGTAGARIVVDGQPVTRIQPDGTTSFAVKPGRHQIAVELGGYQPFTTRITAKAGESVRVTAELQPLAKPAPAVELFEAATSSIQQGQSTELRWRTSNATAVAIEPGIGTVPPRGSQQVNPAANTTYTLTARGEGEPVQRSVTISVAPASRQPAPAIIAFDSGSDKIQAGQTAKLIWRTQNANSVSIEPDVGTVDVNGSREVKPPKTTTYVLTAKGPGGTITDSVQIAVESPPAAPVVNPEVKAVRDTIERFREAYQLRSIEELQKIWRSIPKRTRDALRETFTNRDIRAITVRYDCAGEPAITGDSAQWDCSETLTYTTNTVQRPQTVPIRFLLKKLSGTWYVDDHRPR